MPQIRKAIAADNNKNKAFVATAAAPFKSAASAFTFLASNRGRPARLTARRDRARSREIAESRPKALVRQLRQIAEELQCRRVRESVDVLHRAAVDHVSHGELGDLSADRARNVAHLDDFPRYVVRARV